ncbi:LCP family protein [Anaerosporobacter sp.]|uniref:LCP family protein n=1 Tax=Anaerosporobacter sp. TaxID=1872529 RepID=UPI00286F16E6|nr:LCP family protein [Anaerosporobacter sp.]
MKENNNEKSNSENDFNIQGDFGFDDDSYDIKESLKQQVSEQMDANNTDSDQLSTDDIAEAQDPPKKKHTALKVFGGIIVFLILSVCFLLFTKPGNRLITKILANYISVAVNKDVTATTTTTDGPSSNVEENVPTVVKEYDWNTGEIVGRKEDYVTNILIFGVEELFGASNTDTMMIASINTKDSTIVLSSLMRDSYVSVPDWKSTKLNAAYAHGGIELLRNTIEQNYKIHLDGYAYVNFEAFENVVNLLGGVKIQLGAKEANYLNTTNYISNKAYRNVTEGINLLNGNQALGFCRVRKVPTYDGVNDDFGRTLRQRRLLNAIFEKYKSQNIIQLITTTNTCLGYVNTNLSTGQIEMLLNAMLDIKSPTIQMQSIPIDGAYESPKKYENCTWPILLDWDANILDMYKTIYGDTDEEAYNNLTTIKTTIR